MMLRQRLATTDEDRPSTDDRPLTLLAQSRRAAASRQASPAQATRSPQGEHKLF
jgi:hypothetical protein